MFELSKLDAGQVVLRPEAFCLAELVHDALASYRLKADQNNIELRLDARDFQMSQVVADIALLDRVLQNLIDNALRHTPRDGTVDIKIAAAKSTQNRLQVSITNSGSQISPEHLPLIFERYWQGQAADKPVTAARHSAGLGLAIVKRILELHNTMISVTSEPAFGTRFEFSLPSSDASPMVRRSERARA